MSFSVSLYNFTKKRNSTARPTTPVITETGEIKEDFTPLNFEMTFSFSDNGRIPVYNYAYVPNFSRYYYITDWVYVAGLWRGAFTVDVLATYKSDILASNQFVARCASEKQTGLPDTAYPTIGGSNRGLSGDVTVNQSSFWGADFEDGTFVVGILGNTNRNIGCVTYYAFSSVGFNALMDELLTDISWANISVSEISTGLQKALINPLQYITSVVWLPINAVNFIVNSGAPNSDLTQSIKVGWWVFSIASSNSYARVLYNPTSFGWDYVQKKYYIALDKHPQSVTRGEWLTLSPYSKYVFTFLPFGQFELDTTELYGFEYFGFDVRVHSYNGDAILTMYAAHDNQGTSDKVLQVVNANVGVQIPIGQIALDIGNLDSALTSTALMGATEIANYLSNAPVEAVSSPATKPTKHSSSTHSGNNR